LHRRNNGERRSPCEGDSQQDSYVGKPLMMLHGASLRFELRLTRQHRPGVAQGCFMAPGGGGGLFKVFGVVAVGFMFRFDDDGG